MKLRARVWLVALIAGAIVGLSASAAQASFGVEKFFAANCSEGHEGCGQETFGPFSIPKEPASEKEAEEKGEGEQQAGARVPFGVTDFKVNTEGELAKGNQKPVGPPVTHIRTDVAAGLATSPTAVPQCSEKDFGEPAIPETPFYVAPKCDPSSKIGENKVTVYAGVDVPIAGDVYNLVPQKEGLASEFGVALKLPIPLTKGALEKAFAEKGHPLGEPTEKFLEEKQYWAHTLIEGNVEWGQQAEGTGAGDYHDYFNINVSPEPELISSRLVFFGRSGDGAFITNPTSCPGHHTTTIKLTGEGGVVAPTKAFTALPLTGCNLVPFEPSFSLTPGTTGHDEADGITTEVGLAHNPKGIDNSQLNTAVFKLPEGMTLNESAAAGLAACTPAQARIHSPIPGVACPAASELGTITIDVPTLPPGSLKGKVYLGGPESGPITGPPYVMYLDAESKPYGISVRLKGEVVPSETTGQLTATFAELPEQPFSVATMHLKEGALAPLANPLACGLATSPATTETVFTPFSGTAAQSLFSKFTVDNEGKGGACPASPAFALSQSTQTQAPNGGEHTNFTFNLTRPSGDQFLSQVKTTLPAGLDGAIPAATRCPEPQASEGTCPATSQLGTATIEAGAGPTPFSFSGPVYLTGPYKGAPYGLSIAVPAVAGPFNLGTVVTRATINVDPYTARVTVEATLPRIVKAVGRPSSGVLLRLRKITTTINKQGFLTNPTNCAALATESTLTGYVLPQGGATGTEQLSTPFQVANCAKLAFKPSFKATTSARTSKANGASLETTINQGSGQANIRSVRVQLPLQLPSRLTTLQKACPEAVFAADPFKCPNGSFVGGARANTPLLPDKLKGPAILVSHAAAAFPDLDLVMEADGVRTIVVGNTDIKKGITTTNFATTPDVPVSSVTVNLPIGPHSALAGYGDLCAHPLLMPTTITGQNGKVVKQNTKIAVGGCSVRVVGQKVIGNTAYLTVQTPAAGRISGSGSGLATVSRRLNNATTAATLKVPLSRAGRHRHRPFRVRVRVGFVPKARGPHSTAFVTLTFR
jgi:hypothetical protein